MDSKVRLYFTEWDPAASSAQPGPTLIYGGLTDSTSSQNKLHRPPPIRVPPPVTSYRVGSVRS